ncbi:MAG TPA: hypothetical protein VLT57_11210 [Bryobacteraceae bacterium]|nr:hypothetical protein [Bryobacteraceae bacterium]
MPDCLLLCAGEGVPRLIGWAPPAHVVSAQFSKGAHRGKGQGELPARPLEQTELKQGQHRIAARTRLTAPARIMPVLPAIVAVG